MAPTCYRTDTLQLSLQGDAEPVTLYSEKTVKTITTDSRFSL